MKFVPSKPLSRKYLFIPISAILLLHFLLPITHDELHGVLRKSKDERRGRTPSAGPNRLLGQRG
jgi:hypothetical protein